MATLLRAFFFANKLLKTDNVIFVLVLLNSFTGVGRKRVPLAFVLVIVLCLNGRFVCSFDCSGVSRFTRVVNKVINDNFNFQNTGSALGTSAPGTDCWGGACPRAYGSSSRAFVVQLFQYRDGRGIPRDYGRGDGFTRRGLLYSSSWGVSAGRLYR